MPVVHLAAIGNAQRLFTANGALLNAGLINTYLSGTSTPALTYNSVSGAVANANPIVLGVDGLVPAEIWLPDAVAYKFVITDSLGLNPLTYDNIYGINDQTGLATLTALAATTPPTGASLVGFKSPLTGGTARSVQAKLQDFVSVKDFGAVGDNVADDTAAIQAAVNTGKAVFFPTGDYKITSAITFSTIGQAFFGQGMESSRLQLSGAISGLVSVGALVRTQMRDLGIIGGATSLRGIDCSSGNLYMSLFENVSLSTGGKAFYAPTEFSTMLINVHVSSVNDHGFEIQGGSATTLIGCYAHTIGTATKYGYRIYAGATMIGCNGLDSGSNWALFGSAIAKGDAADVQFGAVLIGCNMEDFKIEGVRLRYNGNAIFQLCTFVPPAVGVSATYDSSVHIEFCNQLIQFHSTGTTSKGSVRTKLADVFSEGGLGPMSFNSYSTWDSNGTLTTIPNVTSSLAAFARYAMTLNQLKVSEHLTMAGSLVQSRTAPAYGVAVVINASLGNCFDIAANNGVAFTINNPTNAVDGQVISVTVSNTSGGALGAVTWQPLYKMSAWVAPATGFSRTIVFKYNGAAWYESARTPADVPN